MRYYIKHMISGSTTKKYVLIGGAVFILAVIGFSAGVFLASVAGGKSLTIPKDVAEQVLFPTHLPDPLPEGYDVAENSFQIEEGALLFQAKKGGKKINFAEQSKPKDFDFTGFYQQQLTNAKNLQDVPYTSILGKTHEGSYLLSVVTDKSWLIVTSSNASESDLRFIAEHLKQQ
jgi:hypothetical protein